MAINSTSRTHSRRSVLGILAAAFAATTVSQALAQSQQTIRLNVPFSPGTGPDLLARILSEELRQRSKSTCHRREQARRERQHRHRCRGARRSGWQHASGDRQYVCDECEPFSLDPLRPREKFCADRGDRDRRSGARRASLAQCQLVPGTAGGCSQQAGRDQLCFARPGNAAASRHGAPEADRRRST